jgi:hypothetical protein
VASAKFENKHKMCGVRLVFPFHTNQQFFLYFGALPAPAHHLARLLTVSKVAGARHQGMPLHSPGLQDYQERGDVAD